MITTETTKLTAAMMKANSHCKAITLVKSWPNPRPNISKLVLNPMDQSCRDWEVDSEPIADVLDRNSAMSEVEGQKVEQIDDKNQFTQGKLLLVEKVAPKEMQRVVNGEMRAHYFTDGSLVLCCNSLVKEDFDNEKHLEQHCHQPIDVGHNEEPCERGPVVLSKVAKQEQEYCSVGRQQERRDNQGLLRENLRFSSHDEES
ncbi:hypothetical protein KL930_004514 [Ogataea haglerorum]|uniref:Uncharacterized protein n=1 Tax=Ogataea haglerorum TaxID=1937702 RepID=A0AAN6D2D0_9ASCO|nr:uncharacterized protein KL911_004868 [Ogataea haglerorum]KAG7692502.1 hypothetical protein KL915_004549 [Ogataea haglerorum]KAG7692737.1 hypothetical protein KL951_004748 [Ogataea haglerorum]KAG7703450.1 hypothetical protein KL950_004678 [Ogataea haglerorum]KAG7703986.1 hypothetical protein KL914_004477 [Ogataea haglerorum]KAG7715606.1 hypothetical protein KL913_003941 [Ogataea haglerorum]